MRAPSGSSAAAEVSTCGWKLPAGQCEPVARSCADCLNVAPTSGDECKLLPLSGLCVRADSSLDLVDEWSAPVVRGSNGSAVRMDLPSLLTASADYCADDDSECGACLGSANSTSSVCYGASGCVCLGACSVEAWAVTASLLLPAVLVDDPFNSSDCAVGTGSEGEEETIAVASTYGDRSWLHSLTSDNECMWTAEGDASGPCRTPRSCFDCLNRPLASGTECTIMPGGLCTTMDAYDYRSDYRLNASAHAPHFFPSANTTYCGAGDATCQACRNSPTFTAAASGRIDPSAFCVGADGCVCVAFCESPSYGEEVADLLCVSDDGISSPAAMGSDFGGFDMVSNPAIASNTMRLIALCVALCVSVPAVAIVWWGQRVRRAARARALAWRNRPPANGPLLGLEGWKKFREELIEQEQRTLQENGDGGEAAPAVSATIELQRPTLAASAALAETGTGDARGDGEGAGGAGDQEAAYVPMTDRESDDRGGRRSGP